MPQAYGYNRYGGPEVEEYLDLPMPTPEPHEVVVEVRAAGVNPADWKIRAGHVPHFQTPFPSILGREVSGVLAAVGAAVEGFVVGDEVFGRTPSGGYTEFAVVPDSTLAHKPRQVSFIDAATLPCAGGTAYDGLADLGVGAGDIVLVTGVGGGVGVATAQIARHLGATVIGTASEAKRGLVERLGAIHVAYGPGLLERLEAVAPDGVDAIYDLVGGDAVREVVGLLREPSRLLTALAVDHVAEFGGAAVARAQTRTVLDALADLVVQGALDPMVTAAFPFSRARDALALVEAGHATGKVVIEFGSD